MLNAEGNTTVTGERDALGNMLDEMERVLSARLADACGYAPVPMGEALELPARLRWAASRRYGSTAGSLGQDTPSSGSLLDPRTTGSSRAPAA